MTTKLQYIELTDVKRERKRTVIDRELERIYAVNGKISVDDVIAEATSTDSPLHGYFEWNDAAAGEKYRKVQAYSLIMASKFVVQLVEDGNLEIKTITGTSQVRRLVSAFKGEGFKMRNEALGDAEMRLAIVEAKKSALRSWCNGTVDISELNTLRAAILQNL